MSDSKRRITPVNDTAVLPVDSKRRNTPAGGMATVSAPSNTGTAAGSTSSSRSSGEAKTPGKKQLPVMAMAGGAVAIIVVVAVAMALSSQSSVTQEKEVAAMEKKTPAPDTEKSGTPAGSATDKSVLPINSETLSVAEMEALAQSAARKMETDPAAPPSELPQAYTDDFERMRANHAQRLLDDAAAFATQKPGDAKGLRKRYDDILRSYRSTPAGEEAAKRVAELPQENPPPALDESVFANGIAILPLLDLEADKVSGEWSREGAELKVARGKFQIPYDPGGDFDIRFVFTRLKDGGPFGLVLRKDQGKQFLLALSVDNGSKMGLSKVSGKSAGENPTTTRWSPPMKSNQKYSMVVHIRSDLVRVYIDGACKIQYETNHSELALDGHRGVKTPMTLGLFSDNVPIQVHAIDIHEVKGKGQLLRTSPPVASAQNSVQTATTTNAAPSAQMVKDVSFAALKSSASVYEQLAGGVYALAANGGIASARSKLDAAKKDKSFSAQMALLEGDSKILAALESLETKAEKGVELLSDRRAFKFERVDGKTTVVGKGTRMHVKGVKNGKIILEEKVGGASAESQLDMQALTPASRLELAQMAIGSDPDGQASYAAGLFVAMHATGSATTETMVENQLELAARNKGQSALLDHLRARMKAREREKAVEKDLAAIKALLAENKNDETRAAVESFIGSATGSATGERAISELQGVLAELRARQIRNGLWVSSYSSDSKSRFKTRLASEAQKKIYKDFGDDGPTPDGPKDNFAVAGRGMLRIQSAGSYEFSVSADDGMEVWVAGKKVVSGNGKKGSLELEKGDHSFSFRYHENGGSASYNLRWKPPGANAFVDIPESALVYDPAKTAEYEKN